MFSLAVKNTKRNKRRTILTGLASLLSVFVVLISFGYQISMVDSLIEINVLHMTGNIRVRKARYTRYEDSQPLHFYIENYENLVNQIENLDEIEHAESLSRLSVSVYYNEEMKRASLIAVDAKDSYFFYGRGSALLSGHFIEKENEILVSPGFLESFSKEVGDTVTLVTRTADGGTNGASFVIAGVLYANDAQIANETIYADINRFSELTHMEDGAIELLITLKDQDTARKDYAPITEKIEEIIENDGRDIKDYEVKTWHEVSLIYPFISMFYILVAMIAILFFLIATTLIINTISMSIMEREKEVSTLAALGYERRSIRIMFIEESVLISSIGSTIGTLLVLVIIAITSKTGFDVSIFGVEAMDGWGFPKLLYPRLAWYWYIITTVTMIAVSFFAAFFATGKIKRIEVADALRDDK